MIIEPDSFDNIMKLMDEDEMVTKEERDIVLKGLRECKTHDEFETLLFSLIEK